MTLWKDTIQINDNYQGSVADVLGADATSDLLLQVIDRVAQDSTELIREEATALV